MVHLTLTVKNRPPSVYLREDDVLAVARVEAERVARVGHPHVGRPGRVVEELQRRQLHDLRAWKEGGRDHESSDQVGRGVNV